MAFSTAIVTIMSLGKNAPVSCPPGFGLSSGACRACPDGSYSTAWDADDCQPFNVNEFKCVLSDYDQLPSALAGTANKPVCKEDSDAADPNPDWYLRAGTASTTNEECRELCNNSPRPCLASYHDGTIRAGTSCTIYYHCVDSMNSPVWATAYMARGCVDIEPYHPPSPPIQTRTHAHPQRHARALSLLNLHVLSNTI